MPFFQSIHPAPSFEAKKFHGHSTNPYPITELEVRYFPDAHCEIHFQVRASYQRELVSLFPTIKTKTQSNPRIITGWFSASKEAIDPLHSSLYQLNESAYISLSLRNEVIADLRSFNRSEPIDLPIEKKSARKAVLFQIIHEDNSLSSKKRRRSSDDDTPEIL